MRAHLLQHVPFEGLGSITPWLSEAGVTLTATRFYEAAALPTMNEVDLLMVMGGPMSVHDETMFPWLIEEKRFIATAIESGKTILGICLGAQLIASALGAPVTKNPVKEIGWLPVYGLPVNGEGFHFPESHEAFHWHGETFGLPDGAVRLAESAACANQAFQLGRSVLGLQFHLETTPETARALCAHEADDLIPSKTVQSAVEILSAPRERYQSINALMAAVLTYLCRPLF